MKHALFIAISALSISSVVFGADAPAAKPAAAAQTPATVGQSAHPQCLYPEEAIDIQDPVVKGTIALTFDDGPNPDTTPHVLDVLKKYGVKATFFLVGSNIVGNEAIVRRTLREGHNIGLHTWTHPHVPQITEHAMHREMLKTDAILSHFPKNRDRVMRFPFGESTCAAESYVEKMHYNIVGWDLDSCDWSYGEGLAKSDCVPKELQAKFADGYQGWIDYQLAQTGGGVILMHDAEDFEARHFEAELLHLRAAGYKFVELDKGQFPKTLHDHSRISRVRSTPSLPAPPSVD